MRPLFLKAAITRPLWGSDRVAKMRGYNENIGSWWDVSAHPNGPSQVTNLEGNPTLLEVIQNDPDAILGPGYTLHEMLRCAYLDTQEKLSIQVHPDDDYAKKYAHDNGKYESWYIVDAKESATLVAGTITPDAATIQKALQENTLDQYLQTWPVKAGDYITIPTGTIHALGKDILAFEVGTNSDTTYRFYDYDRKDSQGRKRPLQIHDSFQVTDFSNQPVFVPAKKCSRRIGDTPYFTVDEWYLYTDRTITCNKHYIIVTNISKNDIIFIWNQTKMILPALDSVFIPYCAKAVLLTKGSHVLISQPKKENQ